MDTNGAWDLFVTDVLDDTQNVRLPLVPGGQPNGDSFEPSISGDGRFVAFESRASNLVPGDTNGQMDVFVLDRDTDGNAILDEPRATSVTRVSVGPGGTQANGPSWSPSISDDGRTVAFASEATNLAPADQTPNIDVYVRDLAAQSTSLVSTGAAAGDSSWAPSLSRDGRFLAFTSTGTLGAAAAQPGHRHVFLRDRQDASLHLVSVTDAGADACGGSGCYTAPLPRLPGGRVVGDDGSRVVFYSAGALDAADTNGSVDAYLRDRGAGTTRLASVKSGGQPLAGEASGNSQAQTAPAISGNGRLVAFTLATSPDDIGGIGDTHLRLYLRDTLSDQTVPGDFPGDDAGAPTLDVNGQGLTFAVGDPSTRLAVHRASVLLDQGGQDVIKHVPTSFPQPGGLRTALTGTLAKRGLPSNSPAVASAAIGSIELQSSSLAHAGTLGQLGLAREHLSTITLGQLPLTLPGGWERLLAGTSLGGVPAQSISLAELYAMPDRPAAVDALRLDQVGLASSPLHDISLAAFALGATPLHDIPIDGPGTAQKVLSDWCTEIARVGSSCAALGISPSTGASDTHSLLSLDLGGVPLHDIPLHDIPLHDIDLTGSPLHDIPLHDIAAEGSPLHDIPLHDISVAGSPLHDIPLHDIPLHDIDADVSPLHDIPLHDIPLHDIATVVDCARVNCQTATLGDAANAGAILSGAVLGDVATVLGPYVLGDLHFYDDITLGQVYQLFPPGTTLGDLLTAIIPPDGYPFESTSIDSSGLQDASIAGTADGSFETEVDNGPAPLYISVTLNGGLHYQPGSSSVDLGNGTTRQLPDPEGAADGTLIYRFSMVSGHIDLHYTLHGPIQFFTQSAAEIIVKTQSFGPTNPTEVFVSNQDNGEGPNNAPDTAPDVAPNSVTASFLDHEEDIDWYKVHVDQPGSRILVTLSHLPTDGDIALYGPPGASPTAFPESGVPLSGQIVGDAGSGVSNQDQVLQPQVLQDVPLDPSLPLRSVSANRALDDEAAGTVADVAGDYRIAVSLYSGAQYSFEPYLLHVTVVPPPVITCAARAFPHTTPAPASLPAGYPDGLNTLFLLDTQRLAATFGQDGADQVQASVNGLVNYLNGSGQSALGVTAAALPVDGSSNVRDAYAAWDANPCSTAAANGTVKSITALLQSIRQTHPNLKYLVMVGGDDQLPLARIPDLTSLSNETDYASTFAANPDELFGSLATGDILSDDVYGDTAPFAGTDENRLFLPRLAVGRLVETPAEIASALDRFRDPTVRGALDATTGLVTGYDFLADGAQSVASALQANLGAGSVDSSLIDPFDATTPWTLGQLQAKVFPSSGVSPDILSLNGHYDHRRALPSAGNQSGDESDLFTTDDLAAHPGALAGRLVFTMGCHAGLQVPDVLLSSGDALSQDWAEGYAQQGALLAANTGYGLGDTNTVAYSERLMALFAKRLDGSLTIGQALAAAKADYYSSLAVIGVYDAKILQEAVFYGLPFYAVGQSPVAAPAARAAAQPAALPIGTDPVTGLAAAHVTLDPSFHSNTARDGSVFFTVGDETPQVTHYRPLQPKTIVDVTQPASVGLAHGALVTALTSSDQTRTITVDRPTVDEADAEPASAFGTVGFPSKLQTLATTTGRRGCSRRWCWYPGSSCRTGCCPPGAGPSGCTRTSRRRCCTRARATSTRRRSARPARP